MKISGSDAEVSLKTCIAGLNTQQTYKWDHRDQECSGQGKQHVSATVSLPHRNRRNLRKMSLRSKEARRKSFVRGILQGRRVRHSEASKEAEPQELRKDTDRICSALRKRWESGRLLRESLPSTRYGTAERCLLGAEGCPSPLLVWTRSERPDVPQRPLPLAVEARVAAAPLREGATTPVKLWQRAVLGPELRPARPLRSLRPCDGLSDLLVSPEIRASRDHGKNHGRRRRSWLS